MRSYFLRRYILVIGTPLLYSLIVLALLQWGMIARLGSRFENVQHYAIRALSVSAVFYLLIYLLKLPITYYSSFVLEHEYGLSSQSLASWCTDELHRFLLGMLSIPVLTAAFLLMRKFERGWHFPVWMAASGLVIVLAYAEPLIVDPIFNHFTPLEAGQLKSSITQLCDELCIFNPSLLVADKSRQTKKINAYVTGLSSSKRVVLYDNLINSLPSDQALVVVAHEIGHYKLNHVLIGVCLAIISMYPCFLFAEWAWRKTSVRLPEKWGIKSYSDPCSISVWCIVVWIAPLLVSPIESSISRWFETEADTFALTHTHDRLAAARLFSSLSKINLSDPDPPSFIEFWFYSHPSIKHRIEHALSFRSNSTGTKG